MIHFTNKKIVRGETMGEKLLEARMERKISLEKAAKDTNIAFRYLSALENNKLSELPGQAYLKIFLKSYCDYLYLDFNDLWRAAKKLDSEKAKKFSAIKKKHFLILPKLVRRLLAVFLILAILLFLGLKVEEIFTAPSLVIFQPQDGAIVSEKQLEIIGQTQPEAEVVINNENISIDGGGKFKTIVDLQKGLNLIKITAKKRYSRTSEAEIRVLVKE